MTPHLSMPADVPRAVLCLCLVYGTHRLRLPGRRAARNRGGAAMGCSTAILARVLSRRRPPRRRFSRGWHTSLARQFWQGPLALTTSAEEIRRLPRRWRLDATDPRWWSSGGRMFPTLPRPPQSSSSRGQVPHQVSRRQPLPFGISPAGPLPHRPRLIVWHHYCFQRPSPPPPPSRGPPRRGRRVVLALRPRRLHEQHQLPASPRSAPPLFPLLSRSVREKGKE